MTIKHDNAIVISLACVNLSKTDTVDIANTETIASISNRGDGGIYLMTRSSSEGLGLVSVIILCVLEKRFR